MLRITLNNLGKKYNREWIFRGINLEVQPLERLLIQGGNGSGKSTLVQIIAGFVTVTEGALTHTLNNQTINPEQIRKHIALASPYLQVIEEFTASELIDHLREAKPFINNLSTQEIIDIAQLSAAKHKYIRHYSSGMKQRLKLALAFLADTPLLLLDEPLSNLDKNAGLWYKEMVANYTATRTVLVCSNAIDDEHFFCSRSLNVMDFKA
jgi:ABC-type multidrug transport system ATPase subunit